MLNRWLSAKVLEYRNEDSECITIIRVSIGRILEIVAYMRIYAERPRRYKQDVWKWVMPESDTRQQLFNAEVRREDLHVRRGKQAVSRQPIESVRERSRTRMDVFLALC